MGSHKFRLAALLLLCAALTWSCESSDVLAPAGSMIVIEASPQTVFIDVEAGQTTGQSLISAQLFDSTGAFPLVGVNVTFTTNGGTLASSDNRCDTGNTCRISGGTCASTADCPAVPGQAAVTDGNGVARDLLTLSLQDPATVDVTARSSTITKSITVTKTVVDGNVNPTAMITASPANAQTKEKTVIFDGRGSTDPDGAGITCYQWTITSNAAADIVVQGRTDSIVSRQFAVEQELSVTLRVSDRDDADTFCADGSPTAGTSFFSPLSDVIAYEIVCDVTPPVANGGINRTVNLGTGGTATVNLSSTGSADPESGIASYRWVCSDNDPAPQNTPSATCTYNATGTYNASLTVTNGCTGSTTDPVTITVNP